MKISRFSLKELVLLIIFFGAALYISTLIPDISFDSSIGDFPIEWELQLKKVILKYIKYDSKVLENSDLNKAVDIIKRRLVENIKDNPFELDIIIIDSPMVNAVAFPGGLIVIFSGLIRISDNPEELSSIIAHELGHVIARDSVKALTRQIGLALLVGVIGGNDAKILGIIKEIINVKFTQLQEAKADDFAIDLLIKSSINPRHFASFFKKLKTGSKINKILKYINTHPDLDSRIKKSEEMSKSFNKKEIPFQMDWDKVKKSMPSIFD